MRVPGLKAGRSLRSASRRLRVVCASLALAALLPGCFLTGNPFESNEERVRLRRSDNTYNCLTFALTTNHQDENNPGFSSADNPAHDFLVCCISVQYGCGGL